MITVRTFLDAWRRAIRPSPYHCAECERPVALGEGVREGRGVWCGPECAADGWERQQW